MLIICMKKIFILVCAVLLIGGCSDDLITERYVLKLPEIPGSWKQFPGLPHWRIEWQDPQARPQALEINSGDEPEISLPLTWASAVIAWPYWPELPVQAGVFRPAGALLPFDAHGAVLYLSWRGGVDAFLYRELGLASADSPAGNSAVPRLPWYFNWPRFRELYDDPSVSAEYRADPWRADWTGIAMKIWQSGFDKRRLVSQTYQDMRIPVSSGPWIGTSPFAAPLYFDDVPVFPVRIAASGSTPGVSSVDTWISPEGVLRCNADTYIFLKWY